MHSNWRQAIAPHANDTLTTVWLFMRLVFCLIKNVFDTKVLTYYRINAHIMFGTLIVEVKYNDGWVSDIELYL